MTEKDQDLFYYKKMRLGQNMRITEIIEIKTKLSKFSFDYIDVPSYETYYANKNIRTEFDQKVLKYCYETAGKGESFDHIFEYIHKKIWKSNLFETKSTPTDQDLDKLIHSLWEPLPIQQLRPGLTVDEVIIDRKTSDIIGISLKKNCKIEEVQNLEDHIVLLKMTDGSITISNLEGFNRKISVHFVTPQNTAEKAITWLLLSTNRVKGYREYRNFYIDLPGESAIDRLL